MACNTFVTEIVYSPEFVLQNELRQIKLYENFDYVSQLPGASMVFRINDGDHIFFLQITLLSTNSDALSELVGTLLKRVPIFSWV